MVLFEHALPEGLRSSARLLPLASKLAMTVAKGTWSVVDAFVSWLPPQVDRQIEHVSNRPRSRAQRLPVREPEMPGSAPSALRPLSVTEQSEAAVEAASVAGG